MTSIKIKAHEHKLSYRNTLKLSATKGHTGWTCDACRRNSKELQQTHSYNCSNCDFDLCKECTQPVKTSKHPHKMVVTDANKIYENGAWGCDNCGTNSSSQGNLPWHCEDGCEFDLCFGCTKSHKSAAHRHLLLKTNPKNSYPSMPGWKCDICSGEFRHENQEKPYECKKCNYDLCQNCMKDTEVQEKVEVQQVQIKMEKDLAITDGAEQVPMVFISYQWDIQDKVLKLKKKLEAKSITCWMDTGKMMGGDDLKKEIDKGIRGCKIVVSCVTKAYSESNACQQEVSLADVLKKPILPVLFESLTWPPEGPMAMPFAPLIYINCEKGLTSANLDTVIETIKSKTK